MDKRKMIFAGALFAVWLGLVLGNRADPLGLVDAIKGALGALGVYVVTLKKPGGK